MRRDIGVELKELDLHGMVGTWRHDVFDEATERIGNRGAPCQL